MSLEPVLRDQDVAGAGNPINPTWMEEPIPPERVSEFVKLKASSRVPIATGEHVYTRWQSKELLVNGAVDYLQNDPDWTGGITELVKICALASAFEVPVVAHGHSLLSALHVAASQSPVVVPMVEYLINHQPNKQFLPQNAVRAGKTVPSSCRAHPGSDSSWTTRKSKNAKESVFRRIRK